MWQKLITTQDDNVLAFQRILLALAMFPHGAQKALGWFGGYGFHATLNAFSEKMAIPGIFGGLAIAAESLGVLFLFTGFLTRLAAFALGMTMIVAVALVHFQNGFFMNWSGQQVGEGFEYHLLVLVLIITLLIRGGGACSLDLSIQKNQSHLR